MSKKSKKGRRGQENPEVLPQGKDGKTAPSAASSSRQYLVAAGAALITFLLYLPALRHDFVHWDDPTYVLANQHITSIDAAFFRWVMTSSYASNWHPLTWVSHALDVRLWGLDPFGHHLTSVVIHGLNTFLLCLLTSRLVLSACGPRAADGGMVLRKALIAGGLTGLLFGIHPLHVESVAWVSERKDVLSTFFFLLSLLAYLRHAAHEHVRMGSRPYVLSLLFFAGALLSKPIAITLPLVLVLIDVYPLRRFAAGGDPRGVSRVLIEKIPFLALSIGSAVITLVAQESGGAVHALEGSPLGERLIVAVKALGTYLWKMLVPAGLSPYYPYPKEVTVLSAGFALAVAAIVAVTAGCAYAWKRGWKALMIAWLFFLVTMMPVLGIVRIGTHEIAERYTYIPSMGVFMVLALGVAVGYERLRGGAGDRSGNLLGLVVALVVVFVGLGWLTTAQIKVWSDSVSLWSAVIERFPDALKAYYSRAEYYIFAGRHRDALKDLDRAVELSPGSAGAYYYRGIVYLNIGQFDKAVADLTKAIERDPANAVAYFYRGGAFFKSARYQEALGDYTYFLNSSAGEKTAEGYYNRGVVLSRLGRHEDAVRDLTSSIDSPDNRDVSIRYKAYLERSAVSLRRGDHGGALKDSDQAIALNPEDKRAYYQKAAVYYAAGDFQNAIRVYSEIIARSPQDSEAYGKRATVYLRLSRQDDALRDFQQAARLGDTRSREFLTKQGHRW